MEAGKHQNQLAWVLFSGPRLASHLSLDRSLTSELACSVMPVRVPVEKRKQQDGDLKGCIVRNWLAQW